MKANKEHFFFLWTDLLNPFKPKGPRLTAVALLSSVAIFYSKRCGSFTARGWGSVCIANALILFYSCIWYYICPIILAQLTFIKHLFCEGFC